MFGFAMQKERNLIYNNLVQKVVLGSCPPAVMPKIRIIKLTKVIFMPISV